jgi:hypothetical protein
MTSVPATRCWRVCLRRADGGRACDALKAGARDVAFRASAPASK